MPRLAASLLALTLGCALLGLAACGEEDAQLLPGETAREINANLDAVQQLAGESDCVGAEGAAQQVSEQVEALEGVDRRLKQALEEGAERLNEEIAECEEEEVEAVSPATLPSEAEAEQEASSEEERRDEEDEEGRDGGGSDDEEGSSGEEQESDSTRPELPPQAEGEGKGLDEGGGEGPSSGAEGEGPPSGGVSPATPAGEGER